MRASNDNFALRVGYVLAGLCAAALILWAAIISGVWYVGEALRLWCI